MRTLASQLLPQIRKTPLNDGDSALIAAALIVARAQGLNALGGEPLRDVLQRLASRLPGGSETDALTAVRSWLSDPTLSAVELDLLEEAVTTLSDATVDDIDWDAELEGILSGFHRHAQYALQLPIARGLATIVDLPEGGSCTCLFAPAATVAWCLAARLPVLFYPSDPQLALLFALMAFGAGRPLTVDRRNPIDGSFMPVHAEMSGRDRAIKHADVVVTVPPLGFRVKDESGAPVSIEAYQIKRFSETATRQFITIVPDGPLFRETKTELELRHRLASKGGLEIISLPPGIFGRTTNIAGNFLRIDKTGAIPGAHMVDGRSMKSQSRGDGQERLLAQQLDELPALREMDGRAVVVSLEQIASNDFVLLPDRYLQSSTLQHVQRRASDLQQVALSDIAMIERGKAPRPLRSSDQAVALKCWEVTPSDIADGVVSAPRREVLFSAQEADRARKVAVRPGDVVISIKGSVGVVGLIPPEAPGPSDEEPWIISQSLAILRLQPNERVPSAEILAASLSAPWVREDLERLSAGSTVRTLSISDLKALKIPVHSPKMTELLQASVDHAAKLRRELRKKASEIAQFQQRLWLDLWNLDRDDASKFFAS